MGDNRTQQQPEQQQTSDPVAQQLLDRYSGKTEAAPAQPQDSTAASLLDRYSSNVTPQSSSSEPPPSKVLQGSIDYWDYVKAKYAMTDEGIKRGWLGTQIAAKGGEGYEEAIKPSAAEQEATQTIEQYRKQNDLENNFILNFATEAGAGIPALIPFMGEMAKGAATGGELGAVAGLAGGVSFLPAAGAGALLGSASTLAQITQGQEYLDSRKKGIGHDKANALSITSGGIQGAISMINFGGAGKAVAGAGKVALGSWSKMAQQFLTYHLKSIPEIGLAAAQQAAASTVGHISQGIAALMDGKPGASPLSLGSAAEQYGKAFLENLAPFTGVIGAGKTLSFGARASGRMMVLASKRTTREAIAKTREFQARVSEYEKQFEEEEAKREEQSLIDEINKIAEEQAQDILDEERARKEGRQQNAQDYQEQRKVERKQARERARVQRTKDRVTELKGAIEKAEKDLENIEDEEDLYRAEKAIAKQQSKLLRAEARLSDIEQGTEKKRPDRKVVRVEAEAEVQRIVEAAKSKFFAERHETRLQEARRVLGLLKKLITSSTKLDAATKSRLLARAIEIDGVKSLERNGEKLLKDQIEKEYETEHSDALDEVKDAVDFDATDKGISKFANHVSAEYLQPTIEAYNNFKAFVQDELIRGSKNYKGLAKQALDEYHKAIEQQKDPLPFEMKARIAAEVIGLVDKSPDALRTLADNIENLKQEGLDAAAKKVLKGKIEIEAIKRVALEDLQAGTKLETDITQADPKTLNKIRDGVSHVGSKAVGEMFSFKGLMRWVSIHSKDPGAFLAVVDVHKPTQRVATEVRKAVTLYHDLLAKHSPDGKFGTAVSIILKGALKADRIGEYAAHPDWVKAEPGRTAEKKLSLTPNQAVKLLMQLNDRQADSSRINGSGYTIKGEVEVGTSTQELLEDYFGRNDRKDTLELAKALREFFDHNFSRLSDAVWDEYGVRPEQNKEYSGYLSHDGDKWDSTEDFASNWNNHVTSTVKPSRAATSIERVQSKKAIAVRDAFTEVYQQIALFEQWNVWREAHKPISGIFGDQGIRNVIKQKFGEGFLRSIDVARRDLIWGPQIKSEGWGQIYNSWLKQYAEVVLLAKPLQFFKQAVGFVGALQKMDEKTLVEGLRDFFKNPEKNWARMTSREFFKNRFSSVMSQHMGALVHQGFEDSKITTLKEYAAIPIQYGDKVSSVITAHTVYYAAKKAGLSEGQALHEAEVFVNESQSSSTVDQLSNMARNPYLKFFTLLTQQPTRRLEEITIDVARMIKHPTAENRLQAWRTTQGAGAAAMAFSGVGLAATMLNPFSSEAQKKSAMEAMAVSFLDPLFSAGGGIGIGTRYGTYYALNKALGWNLQLTDPTNPVATTIKEGAQLPGDTIAFFNEPSLTHFAKVTRDYLFGINVVFPGKPKVKVPESMVKPLGGLTKVPLTGIPYLEAQKILESFARTIDGE